jgi:hypothetical protein
LLKRKKEVALRDKVLIYSKTESGVELSDKEMKSIIKKANDNFKLTNSAFFDSGIDL